MSKKTRPRRHPAPASAAGREDTGTLVERMMGSLWRAVAAGDLLRAELEAATCMALPRVGQLAPEDAQAFISKVLVDEAIRQPSAEGAAMLRLLMSLGSPATKRSASQALARLTEADIYPPDWVTGAGRAVPVQAWRRYDVFGDDEAIAVTFRYGEAEHGIVGQIDLTGIPIAIAVGVAADAASLIEAMSREDDPFDRVEHIGLAEARRRLEAPLARCDEEADPGLPVDTLAYLPVARSRVRRLPAEGAGLVPVFTAADRAAAVDDFLKSPLAAESVAADEEATRFWAEVLTGYSSRIPGEPPAQVGPRKIAHLLLGHVPNTFSLSARAATAPRGGGDRVDPLVGGAARPGRGGHRAPGREPPGGVRPVRAGLRRPGRRDRAQLPGRSGRQRRRRVPAGRPCGRRMFAVPMPPVAPDGGAVDVGDPAVRRARTEAEFAGCTPARWPLGEEFLAAVHRVIAELWDDDPAETFAGARRLFASGADRHDIIHTLAERPGSSAGR